MPHKYKVSQLVRLSPSAFSDRRASADGIYQITRLMPADQNGQYSYRLKSAATGERAVLESEIQTRLFDT